MGPKFPPISIYTRVALYNMRVHPVTAGDCGVTFHAKNKKMEKSSTTSSPPVDVRHGGRLKTAVALALVHCPYAVAPATN